jgi:hypothetical protein
MVVILTVVGGGTRPGTERFTWGVIATRGRALSRRLAIRRPAAGGTGGTNKPAQIAEKEIAADRPERYGLGTELDYLQGTRKKA